MGVKFANNAATTLAAGISSGATSFQVASATGFPSLGGSDYMYLTVDSEVVKVTATSGTTFTCDATSASHSSGDTVELRMSAELLDDFAEDSESLPLSGGQMSGNITMAGSQTVDGRDLSADGTKLDNIEANATADQSATQIKTLLEDGIDSVHYVDGSIDTAHIADDQVTADKLANSINTDIATGVTANTTANAALPKAGGTMTGNVTHSSGYLDMGSGHIYLADNAQVKFGTGEDLQIYHSGNDSYITDGGTGNLLIKGTNLSLRSASNEDFLVCTTDGSVAVKHNNSTKIETTANGVTVTGGAVGTMTTDNDGSFAMSASNNFKCTPTGNFTLTFTSIVAQSGNILLVNSGGHTVAAHANTKVDANLLATVSTAGTYLLSYFSDGTNVYMTNSAIYT